ncbi:hypothetical protein E2P81_ATG03198 [Venturia nashicola]|nr:hypothetical protein E2P81_ATG03198 [Venturia nashicola]
MSSFRSIRPSSSSHNINHADDNNPLSPSLQSEPSNLSVPQSSSVVDSSVAVGKGRKRKAPQSVSQNVCTNCKRARAKCDGAEGTACTRCISRNIADQCNYELHLKTAKEELIRKIRSLELANQELVSSIREKDQWIENVVNLVVNKGNGGEDPELLKPSGQTYQDLVRALHHPPLDRGVSVRHDSGSSMESVHYGSDVNIDSDDETGSRWTSVTNDESRIHHLMALYFSWVHPVHMLFSERHFMGSYRNKNKIYCTPSLINAICALGCCYEEDEQGNSVASKRMGERFAQQVLIETKNETQMTPVSAVTYAILFLVELSSGKGASAFPHLRLAVESLRKIPVGNWSAEAFEITSFGIHTLNTSWSAFTYQKPAAPISPHTNVFIRVSHNKSDAYWKSYRFPKDSGKDPIAGHAIETAKEFTQLSQVIFQTIRMWCGSKGKVSAQALLRLYRQFTNWKTALPDHLARLEFTADSAPQALPHVFSLQPNKHPGTRFVRFGDVWGEASLGDSLLGSNPRLSPCIQYYVAICQLFVPLLECKEFSAAAMDHIRGVCVSCARQGLELCQRYRCLFSNRYQPPMQAFCLLHLSDLILRQSKQGVEATILFCFEMLSESLPGFPMVGPLQAMFCESVLACGYKLPVNVEKLMGGRTWQSYSREDKLECCERLTYAQPVDILVERLDSDMAKVFEDEWHEHIENHGGNRDVPDDMSIFDDDESEPTASKASSTKSSTSSRRHVKRNSGDQRAMDLRLMMNP